MENVLVVVSSSRFFRNLSDATVKSLCSKYGSENVVEKIQNLEEQYTGRDMNNPGGLLRDALKKDYKPTKRIDRKKRDEKNAIEQAKQEKVEKEMHRQEEGAYRSWGR